LNSFVQDIRQVAQKIAEHLEKM